MKRLNGGLKQMHKNFIKELEKNGSSIAETTFLRTSISKITRYAQVYPMVKIHKIKKNKPIPIRLICTTPGSINYGLSKWIDFHLQAAVRSVKHVLKDSFDIMKSINKIKIHFHKDVDCLQKTQLHAIQT